MEKEKIVKISESQASDMLGSASIIVKRFEIIEIWKSEGYIEQSALEKARESYEEIIKMSDYGTCPRETFIKIVGLYEQAIRELEEKCKK